MKARIWIPEARVFRSKRPWRTLPMNLSSFRSLAVVAFGAGGPR